MERYQLCQADMSSQLAKKVKLTVKLFKWRQVKLQQLSRSVHRRAHAATDAAPLETHIHPGEDTSTDG